jgi:hypothetical protein
VVNTKAMHGLSKSEAALVVQTKRSELTELDEDALLDLHRLVRKKRNKYVKLYRRESHQRVKDHGTRDKSLASDSGVRDRRAVRGPARGRQPAAGRRRPTQC